MSYIALARKWRPRTFSELLGQEHLTRALTQSLEQNRVHHAYLFTGTRGVGKTSVARIMAKALNCEQGMSATPCLSCDACTAIEQGRFVDLIEIDAASKTRVEDTRELLDNVQYAPSIGRFKIYLIDEVHMLSQHSFNALLKTLEEPPSHVKFLLATTDPQKLPVTILSRCLQFNLKHVQEPVIAAHLQHILQTEQLSHDTKALTLIAKAAQGSMRDALSLLDQAIASRTGDLNASEVSVLLGHSSEDFALQLLQALIAQNPQQLIAISRNIAQEGGHFRYVLDNLLDYLHRISIAHAIPNMPSFIESNSAIAQFCQHLSAEDTQLFYQIALKGTQDLAVAPTQAMSFEMTLLRMYTFRPADKQSPPLAYQEPSIVTTDSVIPLSVTPAINAPVVTTAEPEEISPILIPDLDTPYTEPTIEKVEHILDDSAVTENTEIEDNMPIPSAVAIKQPHAWGDIIARLTLTGLALTAIKHTELLEKKSGQVILKAEKAHQSLFTTTVITRIKDELSSFYNETIHLDFEYHAKLLDSPAEQKKTLDGKIYQECTDALYSDPVFQLLQKEFSAEIVKESISVVKECE